MTKLTEGVLLFLLLLVAVSAVGLRVRGPLGRTLMAWVTRHGWERAASLVRSLAIPYQVGVVSVALYLASVLSGVTLGPIVSTSLVAFLWLALTLVLATVAAFFVDQAVRRLAPDLPSVDWLPKVVKWACMTVGVLMILPQFGLSISPLLIFLGVVGLAGALAIHDSLANVLAGLHSFAEQPFRLGDYIRLESGEEGRIVGVTWRHTTIETASHTLMIPHRRMAQDIITKKITDPDEEVVSVQKLLRQGGVKRRLIVVSNREPYSQRWVDGEIRTEAAVGGVSAALDRVLQSTGGVWIAWGSGDADREVSDAAGRIAVPVEAPRYTLKRVWLSDDEVTNYYDGYANQVLWPLCHMALERVNYREEFWKAYEVVNAKFAEAILEEVGTGKAVIWIHDYHLALCAKLLKDRRPDLTVFAFWHIPWPAYDFFRIAPQRREILESLLACDLIGFQLDLFRKNFLSCLEHILAIPVPPDPDQVTYKGRTVKTGVFPISIDYEMFHRAAYHLETEQAAAEIRRRYAAGKDGLIGLGVDRLDYSKALVERFQALDLFFTKYPRFCGQFTYIQIAVPTRSAVESYRTYQEQVEQIVAHVNQRHGRAGWRPIEYLETRLEQEQLVPYYRAADLAIVSSAVDGMNLVSKEFLASQVEERGVLLLSEFAGAAEQTDGSFPVNPYDTEAFAEAIYLALCLPRSVKGALMRGMRQQLRTYTIHSWVRNILAEAVGSGK